MRRRAGTVIAAVLVAAAAAGCGVRAEGEPEILRTPPPPTATPSSTEQPTASPTSTEHSTATPSSTERLTLSPSSTEHSTATGSPISTAPRRLRPSVPPASPWR